MGTLDFWLIQSTPSLARKGQMSLDVVEEPGPFLDIGSVDEKINLT